MQERPGHGRRRCKFHGNLQPASLLLRLALRRGMCPEGRWTAPSKRRRNADQSHLLDSITSTRNAQVMGVMVVTLRSRSHFCFLPYLVSPLAVYSRFRSPFLLLCPSPGGLCGHGAEGHRSICGIPVRNESPRLIQSYMGTTGAIAI